MPDPTRQTISATQAPALWNASPYMTRWMLWKHFADAMPIESEEDARMSWGKKMQPLLLDQAADDLHMEVHPNDETYVRRGQLGCSRDAIVIAPDLGPGALETKCVFDYRTWMSDWSGGKEVPRHHEIQLQQQMFVGDDNGSYKWGVIAAWVAGEIHYFRREPVAALWDGLQKEAAAFFQSIKKRDEPDPFGAPVELPFLNALERTGEIVDLSTGPLADDLATAARLLANANAQASAADRTKTACKAKLLGALRDATQLILAGGIKVDATTRHVKAHERKASSSTVLKVFVPEEA